MGPTPPAHSTSALTRAPARHPNRTTLLPMPPSTPPGVLCRHRLSTTTRGNTRLTPPAATSPSSCVLTTTSGLLGSPSPRRGCTTVRQHIVADAVTGSGLGSAATDAVAPLPAATSTSATASDTSGSASRPVDDFAVDQRPVILFDGVCNLCNGGVNFMLDHDPNGAFRLAALQSPAGRRLLVRAGRDPNDLSSIVLVERNAAWIRSEAILRIGARLRVPLPLLATLGFPVPLPLRDAVYDTVANNRYSFFGRTDACRVQDVGKFADRFIVD